MEVSAGELKTRVRRGLPAAAGAQFAAQLLTLFTLGILYRLLSPAEFGLFAMVLPWSMFFRGLVTWGLGAVVVQSPQLAPREVSALWILHVAVASVLAALMANRGLAMFYGQPRLLPIACMLAGTVIVSTFTAVVVGMVERQMHLAAAAWYRFGGQLLGAIGAVAVAGAGGGVWALVVQQYVELVGIALLAWRVSSWRPAWPARHDFAEARQLMRAGGFFSASGGLFFIGQNLDKVLVGAILGPQAAGYYSQAYNLMMRPVLAVTTPVTAVMLPALARAQHTPDAFRTMTVAFYRLVGLALFPAGVGLAIVAPEAMAVIAGGQWGPAAVLLRLLAPIVVVQGLINIAGSVLTALGHSARLAVAAGTIGLVQVAAVVIGLNLGTGGQATARWVAAAVAASTVLVIAPVYLALVMRWAGVPLAVFVRSLSGAALATAIMALAVVLLRSAWLAVAQPPALVLFAVEVITGAAVYAAIARREVIWMLQQLRAGAVTGTQT